MLRATAGFGGRRGTACVSSRTRSHSQAACACRAVDRSDAPALPTPHPDLHKLWPTRIPVRQVECGDQDVARKVEEKIAAFHAWAQRNPGKRGQVGAGGAWAALPSHCE